MNSHSSETLDDLFRHGLAPYRDARLSRGLKAKMLRRVERRASGYSAHGEWLFLRLGERRRLRHISHAFWDEPFTPSNELRVLPAMNILSRHTLAVQFF